MGDYGIVMWAWRRPQYFRKALQSWAQVSGISRVPMTVFLDPSDRTDQLIEIIHEAQDSGALDISYRINAERLGVLVNPVESAGTLFRENEKLQFLIFAEEDLIVSDDVLEYFAWCDKRFRNSWDILLACAHTEEGAQADADPAAVKFSSRFRCWIWATWRDRWEKFLEPEWDRDYTHGGWDVNINDRIIPEYGWKTVLPLASRSQNIGKWEGVHADPKDYAGTLNPSFQSVRGRVSYRLQ